MEFIYVLRREKGKNPGALTEFTPVTFAEPVRCCKATHWSQGQLVSCKFPEGHGINHEKFERIVQCTYLQPDLWHSRFLFFINYTLKACT